MDENVLLDFFFKRRIMKKLIIMFLLCGCTIQEGNDGKNGSSCTVQSMTGGALISCTDGTESIITNGSTAYSVVALINPCNSTNPFTEELLRLGNGELMAHYSNGSEQFLTLIPSGTYYTTDSNRCMFTVDINNNVLRTQASWVIFVSTYL